MVVIRTDVGDTVEEARRIRFEPNLPFTATNVQDAIAQATGLIPEPVPTPVISGMSPYTPTNSDQILLIDSTAGPVTILLQPSANRFGVGITIKDVAGNSDANVITITPNGAETIDGLSTYLFDSKYAAVEITPQAGGWYVKP